MGASSATRHPAGVETSVAPAPRPPQPPLRVAPPPADPTGGSEGNERLTAGAAALLFVLLAVEGVTIVFLRRLFPVHVFVGMLLIPPVALKLGSTGWRMVGYYTGRREYVAKGPPVLPLRLLAPVVVLSTVSLFATGVALLVVGPGRGIVLGLHKTSFAIWLVATGIHVLAHLPRLPRLASADWRRGRGDRSAIGGGSARRWLLAGSIVAGTILAVATIQYAHPWVTWIATFQGHDH